MELTHTFAVPQPIDAAWESFHDIAALAECFPGAQLVSVDGDDFTGTCKVKLGPIALVYTGTATFVERDVSAHRLRIEAKGKDQRGNGTAGATVVMTMAPAGESTDITVVTDLAVTGKPAQFGRGVMQDVSDKLLGQFVTCLETKFRSEPEPEPADPAETVAGAPPAVDAAAPIDADVAAAPDAASGTPAAAVPGRTASVPGTVPGPAVSRSAVASSGSDDALDLGAAVLPVLAKAYWRQAVAGLVGLLAAVLVLRRWRRR